MYAATVCGAIVQMQTSSGRNTFRPEFFGKNLNCILTIFTAIFVQVEPLFKMWKESDLATTKSRVGAIVKIWAKKREI